MVRLKKLSRQSIERRLAGSYLLTPHRTRNALVAEFKETNVMTRNRLAVDQIKSPTRRVEHLKKVTSVLNRTTTELSSAVLLENPRRKTVPVRSDNNIVPSKRNTPRSTPKTTPNVSPTRSVTTRSPTTNRALANSCLASTTRSPTRRPIPPADTSKTNAKDVEQKRNTNDNDTSSRQSARGNNKTKTNNNNKTPPSPAKENTRSRANLNVNSTITAAVSRRRNNQSLNLDKTNTTSVRPSRHSAGGGDNQSKISNLTSKKNATAPMTQQARATRGSDVGRKTVNQPEIRTSSRTRAATAAVATGKTSKQ